jgi:hypothetical protein
MFAGGGRDTVRENFISSGHCLVLIPAPADGVVYRCFQRIAQVWQDRITHQQLRLDGDVPLTAGFQAKEPSLAISRLLDANVDVIARIELQFDALHVTYVRSGGHGPQLYRQSFFDEVRFEVDGHSSLSHEEIGQVLLAITADLHATAATGTSEFTELTDALPLRMRPVDTQRHA